MRITIEATDQLTDYDGVPVRVWKGLTERNVECLVFVTRIAVRSDADLDQFERELREELPPACEIPMVAVLTRALDESGGQSHG